MRTSLFAGSVLFSWLLLAGCYPNAVGIDPDASRDDAQQSNLVGWVAFLYDNFIGGHIAFRHTIAGFLSAGEIGPLRNVNYLHMHSAALALVRPIHATPQINRSGHDDNLLN